MKFNMRTLLVVFLQLEAGVFLVIIPWSAIWDRNRLLSHWPQIAPMILDNCVRGAVTGLGVVLILFGFLELYRSTVR